MHGSGGREVVFSQSCAAALLHSFTALILPKKAPHIPAEGISYDRLPPKYYIPALLPALSEDPVIWTEATAKRNIPEVAMGG